MDKKYILGLQEISWIMKYDNNEKEYVKEEIRREFQLERMILFSDAVFAIVITLMAIEIHIPDSVRFNSAEELRLELVHLLPSVIAYTASFGFIGYTWYQHLQLFSLLKDYDKGIVFRNLLMLFFIGFFPFSASLIARPNHGIFLVALIYFAVIILAKSAQLALQYYILMKRPQLRINTDIHDEVIRFRKSRLAITMLAVMFLLTAFTLFLVKDAQEKPFAWSWFILFPILRRVLQKRIK
ncbi:MAG: TMEM175 family protein [Bacteroidota bacterium]